MKTYVWLIVGALATVSCTDANAGLDLGSFTNLNEDHVKSGHVVVANSTTIVVHGFTYDGAGPDAFFIVGKETAEPGPDGAIPVPYPPFKPTNAVRPYDDKDIPILPAFANQDVTLTLPDGVTADQLKWLAVRCRQYKVNFGQVLFKKA